MIYCVLGDGDDVWEALVRRGFPEDDCLKVGPGQWLVRADASTSKAVWERIVKGGSQPTGLVFPVGGFYGYHNETIWEWLAAKRNVDNGD